ncbi:MAG: NmrA family NAD(P)-binding protein [Gammaproteobacteria bacterium]|nr:NmrA family NAD(P)-binding protein [Gammaproteobacteria bacterium]
MKVVLCGAFGNLGTEILKHLIDAGHTVVAADLFEKDVEGYSGKYLPRVIDVTNKESLKGLCDGADVVITTVGLVRKSETLTNYDVDLNGNLNILEEAKRAGVKHFCYTSVIKVDSDPKVGMLDAKHKFELALKESGLEYVIFRPSGYFYDIAKVFMPMIEKGTVTLLGKKDYHCNVIHTVDLGDFIVKHMIDVNKQYELGGKETYSYKEIALMFAEAAGKKIEIKRAPAFLFDLIAFKQRKAKGNIQSLVRFGKWTMTHELVGDTVYGDSSFKEYIKSCYKKGE